jgi:S-adenosylmethionine uptake transporter
MRGGLLFIAMSLWSHSIQEVPVTTATIMSFTVPLFVLLLASIFLQESVTWSMWIATLMGFGGIVLVLPPVHWSFSSTFVLFVSAAMLFGLLDIINKKYVEQESMLCMLFYSTLTATLLLAFPAMYVGSMPTGYTLLWLLGLGIGSNLILYFLLKSFTLTSVSSLAPFRYLELLISMGVGYVFFGDLPPRHSYWGATIIICCTLFVIRAQRRGGGSSAPSKK